MKLIVGLGNFGKKYQNTYHNMGFWAVEKLAQNFGVSFDKKECKAESAHVYVGGEKIILCKPQTFMNLSGECVREFVKKYKLEFCEILVVCDDIDLEMGALRFREKGSGGTHNGMRNVVDCLKSENFARLRLGIGKPKTDKMELFDFVLSKIDEHSLATLSVTIDKAVERILQFIAL